MSSRSRRTTTPRADDPDRRLAVYGSLAPGRSNHDQMAGLTGGAVEAWLYALRREP